METCASGNYSYTPAYPALHAVQESYKSVNAYVCLALCSYGVITNVINIVVLTKPSMRNSINCILTGIAVADIITMSSYIPFTYYYYIMDDQKKLISLSWITFLAVHMNLTLTTHTTSIWLGVIMAAMRYFFVRPTAARGAQSIDCRSTLVVIVVTFIGAALLIIPNCLVTGIEPCLNNATGLVNWHLKQPSFGQPDSNALHTVTFLVYPIVGKIIPCTLISIFGGLLLHTLRETDKRARRLKGGSAYNSNGTGTGNGSGSGGNGGGGGGGSGNAQTRRTTIMLLAIIALYIISELPQAVLVLLCIFVKNFFLDVYSPLSEFIDLLALTNSAINFITYIAMSTQFRKMLKEVFCDCVKKSSCCCYCCCCGGGACASDGGDRCGACCGGSRDALRSTKYSKTPPAPV